MNWAAYWNGLDLSLWRLKQTSNGDLVCLGDAYTPIPEISANAAYADFGSGYRMGYLARFSSQGYPIWSTYTSAGAPSGINLSYVADIVLDELDYIYIIGGSDYDASIGTPGTVQSTWINAMRAANISCFSPSGQKLWGSYFGCEGLESAVTALGRQNYGNLVMALATACPSSFDFVDTSSGSFAGIIDVYLMEMKLTTSVYELGNQSGLLVYPNPTPNGQVSVQLPQGTLHSLQLCDLSGKVVHQISGLNSASHQWSTGSLAAGCYHIYAITQDGRTYTQKLLVE